MIYHPLIDFRDDLSYYHGSLEVTVPAATYWRELGRKEAHMTDQDLEHFVAAFEHSERDAARVLVSAP